MDNPEAYGFLALLILFNLQQKPFCQFFTFVWIAVQMTFHYWLGKQALETRYLHQDVYGFHMVLAYEALPV